MGGAASASKFTPETLTAEAIVSHLLSSLPPVFHAYKNLFVDNGVDGHVLFSLKEDEYKPFLAELGVTSIVHQAKLITEFTRLKKEFTAAGGQLAPPAPHQHEKFSTAPEYFVFGGHEGEGEGACFVNDATN